MTRLLLALAAGLAAGCGGGPEVVRVSGVATHNGEPVPSLLVTFQPDRGRPSWGVTGPDGRFELEYDAKNKGALVAAHTVSATYRPGTPDEEMGKVKRHPAVKAVADKYGDPYKSPLKVEVTAPTDSLELKFD